ncbi:MAG: glyoxalase/bleomycin resistance/extradiol dioxygenase family protein [Reyranella sp.]|nr:glyoxalase/bleomycin resistance/extradiol dioxygenase family protein [Reyranella sp.]
MTDNNQPVQPPVLGGPCPYLSVQGAAKASDFYVEALGAREVMRMPPDDKGRYMHIHLVINGGSLMLADVFPEHGHPWEKPAGMTLHLAVADVDAAFDKAIKAGAEVVLPPQDMFWGDRYGQFRDPFGVLWSMGAPQKKS